MYPHLVRGCFSLIGFIDVFFFRPVSAYALFFRDTQAAIKGQNPNASFGEVSKIVASMWDSLDEDHKNVYKKRTEAAKKEYLKALAAYRASLVSKVNITWQLLTIWSLLFLCLLVTINYVWGGSS